MKELLGIWSTFFITVVFLKGNLKLINKFVSLFGYTLINN